MVDTIINHIMGAIPWWGWALIIAAPVGALMFYFGPVLLPIWRAVPLPVRAVIVGIGIGFVAWMGGRHVQRKADQEEDARRNADALKKRTEVDREIGELNDGEASQKLRDRWGRDGP